MSAEARERPGARGDRHRWDARLIEGLLWLLGCQLVGGAVTDLLGIPLPGPVAGMLVLFLVLHWRQPRHGDATFVAGDAVLRHLQLLFVPAGVGIVVYLGEIGVNAWPLVTALLASWVLGLVAVGWSMTLFLRRRRG